jgi:hypothetical protein
MNTTEYHQSIDNAPALGYISWKYNNKTIHADIIEIEKEFENEFFVRIREFACKPMVRIVKKEKSNRIYFLTERSSNGEIDWPEFETAGLACHFSFV